MRFVLSATLLLELRQRRTAQRAQKRAADEVEDVHDAFLLDSGMGTMLYLASDGRVLASGSTWGDEPLREAIDDEAIAALVVGAEETGIVALLQLVPGPPREGSACPRCCGERWEADRMGICLLCRGRGWVVPSMLDAARSIGLWPPEVAPPRARRRG